MDLILRLLSNASHQTLGILRHLPYIAMIPPSIATPLHFDRQELEQLRGTPLFPATLERRSKTRESCKQALAWLQLLCFEGFHAPALASVREELSDWVRSSALSLVGAKVDEMDLPEPGTMLEMWRWGESAYGSRAFPPHLAFPRKSADEVVLSRFWPGEVLAPILIPGLDSINHGRGVKVTWEANSQEEPANGQIPDHAQAGDRIALRLHDAVPKARQVLNNYGAKSNEELLGSYGFVLDDGTDDAVALVVGGNPNAPDVSKKRCYWRRTDDKVPPDLFDVMMSMMGIADAHDDPHEAEELRQDIEVQLEINDTLAQMFTQKLQALQTVRKASDNGEGMAAASRPELVGMIQTYVQGAKPVNASIRRVCSLLLFLYRTNCHLGVCDRDHSPER